MINFRTYYIITLVILVVGLFFSVILSAKLQKSRADQLVNGLHLPGPEPIIPEVL